MLQNITKYRRPITRSLHASLETIWKTRFPRGRFSSNSQDPVVEEEDVPPEMDRELDGPRDVLVQQLMEGNDKWLKIYGPEFEENWFDVLNVQTPRVTCLTCGDSRVSFGSFGCDSPNEMFGIRNIGNQVLVSEGSVKFGLLALKTPIMVIMGHTGCGAIKGSLGDYRDLHESVQREIVGLIPSIKYARDKVANASEPVPEELKIDVFAEINVDFQVARLMDDPLIRDAVKSTELTVIGMMFDIHNVYETNFARIKIINVNGDNNINSVADHEVLGQLQPELKSTVAQRLFHYEQ